MPTYTRKQIQKLEGEEEVVYKELDRILSLLIIELAPSLKDARAKEYLFHGACRRLNILKRCIQNIFATFPANRTKVLAQDERIDVEINLHSFMINVYGVLDNLAWIYVLENSLEGKIKGKRKGVGLFIKETLQHLPLAIRTYLESDTIAKWYTDYAKNYRDALVHRIPLYVPPAAVSKDNEKQFRDLENRIEEMFASRNFSEIETLWAEQDKLNSILPVFVHSLSNHDPSDPMLLHPQIIVDVKTIAELITLSCKHFHDYVAPIDDGGENLHERIARRAYEIYERRGRQGPLDDWLQAEREIVKRDARDKKPVAEIIKDTT